MRAPRLTLDEQIEAMTWTPTELRRVHILQIFVEARWPAGRRSRVRINTLLQIGRSIAERRVKQIARRAEIRRMRRCSL